MRRIKLSLMALGTCSVLLRTFSVPKPGTSASVPNCELAQRPVANGLCISNDTQWIYP